MEDYSDLKNDLSRIFSRVAAKDPELLPTQININGNGPAQAAPIFRLVSCLRVEVKGGHWHLGIWVHGAKAGELIVRREEAAALIKRLAGPETIIEDRTVAHESP